MSHRIMVPRFRFAPSPTGMPHVGNLHTALFSWALARSMDGEFIIRVEDTDPARNTPEALSHMLEALAWLGIDWDEGPDIGGEFEPYLQSQRLPLHLLVIEQLTDGDHAYYGDDPERSAAAKGNPLRLRMPRSGQIVLNDVIRGPIRFSSEQFQDPIIVRSDGQPLYHLAAIVDDHDMAITHVVRAEEWIASSPIHIQLYHAMGWEEPLWIHLPLILNPRGQKLGKRDPEGGYQLADFQAAGYLPEALFNYLLLLGWAPTSTPEIFSWREIRREFGLERLSASPSIFDWEKLNWVNRQHLRGLSKAALAERVRPFLEEWYDTSSITDAWLIKLTGIVREQLSTLGDVTNSVAWAFDDEIEIAEVSRHFLGSEAARTILSRLVAEIAAVVLLDELTAHGILRGQRERISESHGLSAQEIYQPVRVALTGRESGPPVHEIMGILGKERTLQRLGAALRLQPC